MSSYNDLYVRGALNDDGTLPRGGDRSPDLIPRGTVPSVDPQKDFGAVTYDRYVAEEAVYGAENYFYVRAKYYGQGQQTGTVTLYHAKTSQLNTPASWTKNLLKTEDGETSVTIEAYSEGDIAVTTDPFVWTPPAPNPDDPYSLVCVVATKDHPNPLKKLPATIDFPKWMADQGGVGWYELKVKKPAQPTFVTVGQFDLQNKAGDVNFTITCQSVPVGTVVAFESDTPAPDGNPVRLPPTTVTSSPFLAGVKATLDANYSARITFAYDSQHKPALAGNTISMKASMIVPPPSGTGPSKEVTLAQYTTSIFVPKAP